MCFCECVSECVSVNVFPRMCFQFAFSASAVVLIWLELITFFTLLASRFQAVDPTLYAVTGLGFAVSSREFTNQNLCKT